MPDSTDTLFDQLPDPAFVVSADGATLRANQAAEQLAESLESHAQLADLFGSAAAGLLAQAVGGGLAEAFLPVSKGPEPHRVFRVAVQRLDQGSDLLVSLMDISQEIAWREQLFARTRELRVLNDIGAALSATLDLDALAERIHQQTSRIRSAANFYIAIYDRAANTVAFPYHVEDGVPKRGSSKARPFSNGLTEHVLRTRQPLLLNQRLEQEAAMLGIEPHGRTVHSWLGVPMIADGEALGVIALQDHEREGVYTDHDIEVMSIIGGQAAAAFKNAQLFAAAKRAFQELSEAQPRLIESERLRSITETVGALNHEVNNPLASIAGNAQLLLRNPGHMDGATVEKVKRILEAAQRIQSVTGRMSNLIQATSMPYPGQASILDVTRSRAREDAGPDAAASTAA